MRVVVLGGLGNFGARICRRLAQEPNIDVIAAGRHRTPTSAVAFEALDIHSTDFASRLAQLEPDLVIHCVGPYQGQDYRVVRATLAARSHYLDLADGREFVTRFASENDQQAKAADRAAVTGASTLPALSSAVVDAMRRQLVRLDEIAIAIAPGQRAPRGAATIAAVLGYAG